MGMILVTFVICYHTKLWTQSILHKSSSRHITNWKTNVLSVRMWYDISYHVAQCMLIFLCNLMYVVRGIYVPICQSNVYDNSHIGILTNFLAYNRHVYSFIYFHYQWCSRISSLYLSRWFDWKWRRKTLHWVCVYTIIYTVLLTLTVSTFMRMRSQKFSNSLSTIAIGP